MPLPWYIEADDPPGYQPPHSYKAQAHKRTGYPTPGRYVAFRRFVYVRGDEKSPPTPRGVTYNAVQNRYGIYKERESLLLTLLYLSAKRPRQTNPLIPGTERWLAALP